jgi:hypothetical protein
VVEQVRVPAPTGNAATAKRACSYYRPAASSVIRKSMDADRYLKVSRNTMLIMSWFSIVAYIFEGLDPPEHL